MKEDETSERWRKHAQWNLGEITNGEYADFLEEVGGRYDPAVTLLVERLRQNPERRVGEAHAS